MHCRCRNGDERIVIKFGTGGWRAIIGEDFTKENIQLLCFALCGTMQQQGVQDQGVCIGYDRRFLSKQSSRWAAEVFSGCNIPCLVLDREAPTPLIMFTVRNLNLPYGLAITASHNPAIYNGIKVFTRGGQDAAETVTDRLEANMQKIQDAKTPVPTLSYEQGMAQGKIREFDAFNEYIDGILHLTDLDAVKNARLKIALDPMYGVGRTSLQVILLTTRCEVEVIHDRHDTLFGGRLPSPSLQTLGSLSRFVEEQNCDLGIATDGDADRIGIIDDNGAFIHPNKILVMLYYYLLAYKGWRGAAVRNNSTTHLLDRIADDFHERCYEVPVGFKHISAKMQQTNALIGGESSGGLTVRGHIPGKDGIYAAALLVEMKAKTGKSFSRMYEDITQKYGELFMYEDNTVMTQAHKQQLMQRIFEQKALPKFPFTIDHISYADGCKVYFVNGGWVICRFSGTEPLLRMCAEMPHESDAQQCITRFKSFLGL